MDPINIEQVAIPKQNTDAHELLPLADWQLMKQLLRNIPDGPHQEIGIKTPDGKLYPYMHGESTVFVREGASRKPMVRLADGSQVDFELWQATRRDGVQKALDTIGGDFEYMYIELLRDHPYLAQLDITTAPAEEYPVLLHTAGFWRRPTREQKNPNILVNAESGRIHFESLFQTREPSARRVAQLLGISYEELKQRADLLGLFIFMHEVGHADDYILNYHLKPEDQNPSATNESVRQAELDSLPVPGTNPADVRAMYIAGDLETYYTTYREFYMSRGITSVEDLLQKHEMAYRDLPSEAYADRFAAEVLRHHAVKLGFRPDEGKSWACTATQAFIFTSLFLYVDILS